MSDRETYSVTAVLVPQPDTATLLRIVSILHSRGAQVRQLNFDSEDPAGATVTARVTSGNAGSATLRESLRRVLDVVEVNTELERPLDLVSLRG